MENSRDPLSPLNQTLALANRIENMLIESEGELTAEAQSIIDSMTVAGAHSADTLATLLSRLEMQSDYLRAREAEFKASRTQIETYSSYVKERIKNALELGIELVGDMSVIKLQANPGSVQVLDEEAVPEAFKTEVITVTVDKKAIASVLKLGESVPGCEFVKTNRIAITNKKLKLEGKK